jgi:hypothetical protein
MLSDVLFDAAAGIRSYREDYPDIYGHDTRMSLWFDAITAQLDALAQAVGQPPPPDDRTIKGECSDCKEITTIRLGVLACDPCIAKRRQQVRELMEFAMDGGDPGDPEAVERHNDRMWAEMAAHRSEQLNVWTLQLIDQLKRLNRADRDRVLNAITNGLLEAR